MRFGPWCGGSHRFWGEVPAWALGVSKRREAPKQMDVAVGCLRNNQKKAPSKNTIRKEGEKSKKQLLMTHICFCMGIWHNV